MDWVKEFQRGWTYEQYRSKLDDLMASGKTTGDNHSGSYLEYTRMNMRRMDRLQKTPALQGETISIMKGIESPMLWLTITEGWCGDAAQIIPIQERMAAESPNVLTRYILRGENHEIMDRFLTDGGRAIPITIVIDAQTGSLLGHWGPRPKAAQDILHQWKAAGDQPYSVFSEQVHTWYAKNKTVDIQKEFSSKLKALTDAEVHS